MQESMLDPLLTLREEFRGKSREEKELGLLKLKNEHGEKCLHCASQIGKLKEVFGEGDACAKIMFVGEGPGEEEDRQGRPFVGRAGKLLDKQITAMGLLRSQVYIANIVKVRPPGNRVPTYEEAVVCSPYLRKQIAIIQPEVIIALGATSTKYLLGDMSIAIGKARGKFHSYEGAPLMPTFHPAYLLRAYTQENRLAVWSDLCLALKKVGLPIPKYDSRKIGFAPQA